MQHNGSDIANRRAHGMGLETLKLNCVSLGSTICLLIVWYEMNHIISVASDVLCPETQMWKRWWQKWCRLCCLHIWFNWYGFQITSAHVWISVPLGVKVNHWDLKFQKACQAVFDIILPLGENFSFSVYLEFVKGWYILIFPLLEEKNLKSVIILSPTFEAAMLLSNMIRIGLHVSTGRTWQFLPER